MERARPDGRAAALASVTASAIALIYAAASHGVDALAAVLLLVAAALGVAAWGLETRARRRIARHLLDTRLTAQADADEVRRELRATEERAETNLARERERLERLRRRRELELEWLHELRLQVARAHRDLGTLADPNDLEQLVLRTSLALVGGEKGMLLSRLDENDDGDLDVAASYGFDHDPADSAVAQHFATCVLDRDRTVRDDRVEDRETAADEEIHNLVAIPIYVADRFDGVVICCNKPGGFHEHDDEVLLALGDHAGAILRNTRLQGALRDAYLTTVAMLADAIEAKDPFLHGHSHDVSRHVVAVARRLGLGPRRSEEVGFAALLHDVGKIGISERILLKPAALTPEERAVMEQHPRIGFRLLERIPALRDVASAVLHHHERWDGDGYPARLRAEQIPVEARLVAVADAFSAMTSDRPYRDAMSVEEACDELKRCAGDQFDPEIVRLFVDEVARREPPIVAAYVEDPEVDVLRRPGEPLLGFGSFGATDHVTLLRSHRHFHELVHAECDRAALQDTGFCVVLAELVDLPRVNDEEGFDAGDDLIRRAARAVEKVASRAGGTACRYSGRRIAMVVPGAGTDDAERFCDEVVEELADVDVRLTSAAWQRGDRPSALLGRLREPVGAAS